MKTQNILPCGTLIDSTRKACQNFTRVKKAMKAPSVSLLHALMAELCEMMSLVLYRFRVLGVPSPGLRVLRLRAQG